MRYFILALSFIFLFGAVAPVQAAEYYWPSTPRSPARLKEVWLEFDQIRVKTYTVNLQGVNVQAAYLARFSVGEADPRWNANFVIAAQPSIKIGLAGYRKGDFIPGVDRAALKGYVEGLKIKGATQVDSTVSGTLADDLMIDGIKPEIVEYVAEDIKYREYFVEVDGRVIVFGYQAPVKYFPAQEENARMIVARMRFLNN